MKSYSKQKEKKIIFFTGAGISAPSGISTFRDSNGLWENHKIDDVCNEHTWKKNFELVHEFYNQRRTQLNEVDFNYAHKVIADISKEVGVMNTFNLTQNVDDLFERVNLNPIHLHGELTKMQCEACGNNWDIGYKKFNTEKDRCPKCNSLKGVRPDIVFFYGQAPEYKKLYNAFDHAENEDSIVVVIGTMGNVIDIDGLLKGTKCTKILCNLEKSESINDKNYDYVFYKNCIEAIDEIKEIILNKWNNS